MFNIEDFLKRFEVIKDPADVKKDISALIERVCGPKIEHANIDIQGNKLILKAHPAIKSAIFLRKEKLLLELKEKFPDKGITVVI